MHRVAEAAAAHWLCKSAEQSTDQVQQRCAGCRTCFETQQQAGNPNEFLEHLKVDLFPDEVTCSRPRATSASRRAARA